MAGYEKGQLSVSASKWRARIVDYVIYLSVSVVLVTLFWWTLMNDKIENEEDITRWGGLGLSTIILSAIVAPLHRRSHQRVKFWAIFWGLLLVRVLVLKWVLWTYGVVHVAPYAVLLPIETIWMNLVLRKTCLPQKSRWEIGTEGNYRRRGSDRGTN